MAVKKRTKVHSKRCCNLFQLKGHVGTNLRTISGSVSQIFTTLPPTSKICPNCRNLIYDKEKNVSHESNVKAAANNIQSYPELSGDLNASVAKKKCHNPREEVLEELLDGVKNKFNSLPEHDPLRTSILTIAPDSWTIRQIAKEFGCSFRMARESKNLKKCGGILAVPPFKKGKNLDEKTVTKVIEFYESEKIGRIMPNKKDTVTIKSGGKKEIKQKHLLLHDVKILHRIFKEKYPEYPLGLSKFAELRPIWCVLAGSSGTHSVCVCTIYQNFKTMIDAANLNMMTKDSEIKLSDYKDCIKYVLCRTPTDDCHFRDCSKCSSTEKFSDLILNLQQIIFSTWTSTDRCTLVQECMSAQDFVETLCKRLEKLIPHHFISQAQTVFLSIKKQNLRENEVLVYCDLLKISGILYKMLHKLSTIITINVQSYQLYFTIVRKLGYNIKALYYFRIAQDMIQQLCI